MDTYREGSKISGLDLQIARAYATAIFQLAKEANKIDTVLTELRSFVTLFESQPLLAKALCSPVIPRRLQQDLLSSIIGSSVSDLCQRFLVYLVDRGRMKLIYEIMICYSKICNEHKGITEVTVELAAMPGKQMVDWLRGELQDAISRPIELYVKENPGIIGGIIIHIGSMTIDNSLSRRVQEAISILKAGIKEVYDRV